MRDLKVMLKEDLCRPVLKEEQSRAVEIIFGAVITALLIIFQTPEATDESLEVLIALKAVLSLFAACAFIIGSRFMFKKKEEITRLDLWGANWLFISSVGMLVGAAVMYFGHKAVYNSFAMNAAGFFLFFVYLLFFTAISSFFAFRAAVSWVKEGLANVEHTKQMLFSSTKSEGTSFADSRCIAIAKSTQKQCERPALLYNQYCRIHLILQSGGQAKEKQEGINLKQAAIGAIFGFILGVILYPAFLSFLISSGVYILPIMGKLEKQAPEIVSVVPIQGALIETDRPQILLQISDEGGSGPNLKQSTIEVSDENGFTISGQTTVKPPDGLYFIPDSALKDGLSYTITVHAVDGAGNTRPFKSTFYLLKHANISFEPSLLPNEDNDLSINLRNIGERFSENFVVKYRLEFEDNETHMAKLNKFQLGPGESDSFEVPTKYINRDCELEATHVMQVFRNKETGELYSFPSNTTSKICTWGYVVLEIQDGSLSKKCKYATPFFESEVTIATEPAEILADLTNLEEKAPIETIIFDRAQYCIRWPGDPACISTGIQYSIPRMNCT